MSIDDDDDGIYGFTITQEGLDIFSRYVGERCVALRKGVKVTEVLHSHPASLDDGPWVTRDMKCDLPIFVSEIWMPGDERLQGLCPRCASFLGQAFDAGYLASTGSMLGSWFLIEIASAGDLISQLKGH